MVSGQAVRVAGIGCRRSCPAVDIVALVRAAAPVDALAAPAWKRHEPGLLEAARTLNLPLLFVDEAELTAAQPHCPTKSAAVRRAVGFASVAEAAALAHGGRLVQRRQVHGMATCAVADGSP
jgi:cobalamin biosynthesis protein CbiG